MEEKHRKNEGFNSGGKECECCVWNEGIEGRLSRGTVRKPVLLEEKENVVQAHGKFSCNTLARAIAR
jgi:hypothetical protein